MPGSIPTPCILVARMDERDERIAKARRDVADAKRRAADANQDLVKVRLALVAEEKKLRQRLATAEVAATAAARSDSRSTEAATEELAVAQRLCSAWESEAGITLG